MHFKQEFKFTFGDKVFYKDPKSGETEKVTIKRIELKIDKDGQKPFYVCMENTHKHVGYWEPMSEDNLSFAEKEHAPRFVEDNILDGFGEHLYIGDVVNCGVYYHCNGISVHDRIPNVDFSFAEQFEILSFSVEWEMGWSLKDGHVVDDKSKISLDKKVQGKLTLANLTVGERRYGMGVGWFYQASARNTEKNLPDTFAEDYVRAIYTKNDAVIGRMDAKQAWVKRDENTHTFYVIKRWLTHLGKFDEVCKLMDQNKKPKKPRVYKPRKKKDKTLDDIMAKLKADPSLLAKVKDML